MAIDVRSKTQEVVAQIEHPAFLQQIEDSLPEGVSVKRFVSVAKTAVRTSPDLVNADQTSLFASIVRCAQDGLFPDGREAALVIYKGKVGYLPMIGGIRRIAAVYGWQIRTNVVYANDEFDYTDEPPSITHRSVRPGEERGELVAAYAVATHRDGRRVQTVLHPADIAKRRAKAQTTKVWDEFTPQMWEKSAGHDVFGQLSLDPADARVSTILQEGILDPIAALYGKSSADSSDRAADGVTVPNVRAGDNGDAEAAAPVPPRASPGVATPTDIEPEDGVWEPADDEQPAAPTAEEIQAAGLLKVGKGVHIGKTIAEVSQQDDGPAWLLAQLKKPGHPDEVATFVRGALPDTWAAYVAWRSEQ